MKSRELIELYILQKNYHRDKPATANHPFITACDELKQRLQIEVSTVMVEPEFKNQPKIPVIVFKPQIPTGERRPLIVHTHGGPHVYFYETTPHAEILALLAKGYVVICPNYRGSNYYPDTNVSTYDKDNFTSHRNSKNNLHVYAPEDVYIAAKFMQGQHYIDPDKITLRGGSFGSFVNAHLLTAIKAGKFKNIFNGVHLCGGVKYPIPAEMHDDIPMFIAHATQDAIAKFSNARVFMEQLLSRNLVNARNGKPVQPLETHLSNTGDHHMIAPHLATDMEGTEEDREVASYLERSFQFIDAVNQRGEFTYTDHYQQYLSVMGAPICKLPAEEEAERRIKAADLVQQLPATIRLAFQQSVTEPRKDGISPTMAHMKLVLKDQYTGEVATDLANFLLNHFKPVNFKNQYETLRLIGSKMHNDSAFFAQSVEMVEFERAFLTKHPDHMVMYHSGNVAVLQIYTFITIWKSLLTNQPINEITCLNEFRLFEYLKSSLSDIELFLEIMRKRKIWDKKTFNYLPGFSERAIAFNPALTFNPQDTSSMSWYWYFVEENNGVIKYDDVFSGLFQLMGIYTKERMKKYKQFFKREMQELNADKTPQAVMQQVFITYEEAVKSSYMCLIWGEEFKPGVVDLAKPERIREFTEDSAAFEKRLQGSRNQFTNYGNLSSFGNGLYGKEFNYSASMQGRHLSANQETLVRTYVRNPEQHQRFVNRLLQMIKADLADFYASTYDVSDALVKGAQSTKQAHQTKLGFFSVAHPANLGELILQQKEIYLGHVMDPTSEWYQRILTASKETKALIQDHLNQQKLVRCVSFPTLYAVCIYVKGYTYFDLLQEAADDWLQTHLAEYRQESEKQFFIEFHKSILNDIATFASPVSIITQYAGSDKYHRISNSLRKLENHDFDPVKHENTAFGNEHTESSSYYHDLGVAVECVLRNVRLCRDANHDDESHKMSYLRKAF